MNQPKRWKLTPRAAALTSSGHEHYKALAWAHLERLAELAFLAILRDSRPLAVRNLTPGMALLDCERDCNRSARFVPVVNGRLPGLTAAERERLFDARVTLETIRSIRHSADALDSLFRTLIPSLS